jgi:hypothetical protein
MAPDKWLNKPTCSSPVMPSRGKRLRGGEKEEKMNLTEAISIGTKEWRVY